MIDENPDEAWLPHVRHIETVHTILDDPGPDVDAVRRHLDILAARLAAELTTDYLRPALRAHGVADADLYEIAWNRSDLYP